MHPIPMGIFFFFLLEQPNKYQPLSRSRTRRGGRGRGGGGRYREGGQAEPQYRASLCRKAIICQLHHLP